MSFPRYPKYKPSGVDWLGDVPEHWDITALKRGFEVTLGKMLQPAAGEPGDELLPYLRAANIQWTGVDLTDIKQMWFSKGEREQLRLVQGDLLVSEGGDVGRSCLWMDGLNACYFQNSVNRLRARENHSTHYLYYWMATIKDKGYIDVLCNKSTIAHFTAEKVAAIPVPYPTDSEQTAIVEFLDRETAKIDELMGEQRRLIELLKEKRQAIISHAVTRGLNPHAPLKPSGIEWLSNVPAQWEVLPLRRSVRFLTDYEANGSFADTKENVTLDTGEPYAWYVRATDLENKRFGLVGNNRFCDEQTFGWLKKTSLHGGELLVAKRGEIGKVYVMPNIEGKATLAPNLYLIRLTEKLLPRYTWYWFSVDPGNAELVLANKSTTIGALYKDDVKSCIVLTPSDSEQVAIIAFLDIETAKLDTLTAEAQRAIALLQERRAALISAAVTGQIDVRPVGKG